MTLTGGAQSVGFAGEPERGHKLAAVSAGDRSRATTMLVTMKCEVTLIDSTSQKVLYHTDNFLFRNEYEISTDVKSFFEEQDPALDRMAQDFAKRLVAAVTENY